MTTIEVQVVIVTLDLPAQIKFDDLMANPALVTSLKDNVAQKFADAAGVDASYVTVTFSKKARRRLDARKSSLRRLTSSGGVQAEAQIVAPQGQSVANVETSVQNSISASGTSSLAAEIVSAVLATPGIDAAAPGYNMSSLIGLRQTMIDATTIVAATQTRTMVLEAGSTLALAAQANEAPTTTTSSPTFTDPESNMIFTVANTTTQLPSEGTLSGSRALAAMTVSTAATAVLIAVSA